MNNFLNKPAILVIAGPSGCGKSTLEKNLIAQYPEIFSKCKQVTTRKRREGEEETAYLFLSKDEYKEIENKLVGKIKETEKFGFSYGTLYEPNSSKIQTMILSEEGIDDLLSCNSIKEEIIIIGIQSGRIRPERKHLFSLEIKVLEKAEKVFNIVSDDDSSEQKWVQPLEVVSFMKSKGILL